MSYIIEFSADANEGLYQDIALVDVATRRFMRGDDVDHQLVICGMGCDYGEPIAYSSLLASNSNGLITTPQAGVLSIGVPASRFAWTGAGDDYGWRGDAGRSLRHKILAVPSGFGRPCVLATGTISFGDRLMPPRITLAVTPMYPNNTAVAEVGQVQAQLSAMGAYDAVEAALPSSPVDPARIAWAAGGPVKVGGPLSNVIAGVLHYDAIAMAVFLTAAAAQNL